jgi:hypothetical protein
MVKIETGGETAFTLCHSPLQECDIIARKHRTHMQWLSFTHKWRDTSPSKPLCLFRTAGGRLGSGGGNVGKDEHGKEGI